MRLNCDACGALAPDVVAEILFSQHGWGEFDIDGVKDGRQWKASILLCDDPNHGWRRTGKGCASRMQAFVDSGGRAGEGPTPPDIWTFRGGQKTEPEWLDQPACTTS